VAFKKKIFFFSDTRLSAKNQSSKGEGEEDLRQHV
jgi:hypothetical protein